MRRVLLGTAAVLAIGAYGAALGGILILDGVLIYKMLFT